MQRREFMQLGGLALAGLALPPFGRAIAAEELVSTLDRGVKKALADVALEAARASTRMPMPSDSLLVTLCTLSSRVISAWLR